MKHNIHRSAKPLVLPRAWREAEYAALRFNAADTRDDRFSNDIYDVDDEHAEVDLILHDMEQEA